MTEPEPTVQVPVSLIEKYADVRTDLATMARQERTPDHWAIGRNQRTAQSALIALDELLALLSQPTPTAEKDRVVITRNQIENGVREVIEDGEWSDADDLPPLIVNAIAYRGTYLPTAEPPRIEDMAPGTTFTARLHQVYSDNRPFTYMVTLLSRGKRYVATDGTFWSADQFDPSTIRDVTPPTESTK